jgi:hypothetical protein
MTFKFLKIIGIGFILSVSTLANATFIDNGDYTTDTESGLDWLDWSETLSDTQAQAVAEFNGDGWRIATSTEANDLLERYFDVNFDDSIFLNSAFITAPLGYAAEATTFRSLFGTAPGGSLSAMTIVGSGMYQVTDGNIIYNLIGFTTYADPGYFSTVAGVPLVRTTDAANSTPVDEPAIITIFALGLAVIRLARRRRQS